MNNIYNSDNYVNDTFDLLLELMEYNSNAGIISKDYHFSFATQALMESNVDCDIKTMSISKLNTPQDILDIVKVATRNNYTLLYYPAMNRLATVTRNIMIDIDRFDFDKLEPLKRILSQLEILEYTNICYSGGGLHIYIISDDYDIDIDLFNRVKIIFSLIANRIGTSIDETINLSSRFRCPLSFNTKYNDKRRVMCIHRAEYKIPYSVLIGLINELKDLISPIERFKIERTLNQNVQLKNVLTTSTNRLYKPWTYILTKIIDKNNGNRNTGVRNMLLFLIDNNIITDTMQFCEYVSYLTSDEAVNIYRRKDGDFTTDEVLRIASNVYRMKKHSIESVELLNVNNIPDFLQKGVL